MSKPISLADVYRKLVLYMVFFLELYVLLSIVIILVQTQGQSNPWEVLDDYSGQAKIRFCEAYDYRPIGVGKLFNEFAREGEPIGTTDQLEEYLAGRCG